MDSIGSDCGQFDVAGSGLAEIGTRHRSAAERKAARQLGVPAALVHFIEQRDVVLIHVTIKPANVPAQQRPMNVVVAGKHDHHIRMHVDEALLQQELFLSCRPSRECRINHFVTVAGRAGALVEDFFQEVGNRVSLR